MKRNEILSIGIATVFCVLSFNITHAYAEQATPGYNHKIPAGIMTPDVVDTRIGKLDFNDGRPSKQTVQKVYDNLDFARGMETFLNFIPATSVEGVRL
jgi:hypothetical protein